MKLDVITLDGKVIEQVELNEVVFGADNCRSDLMHRVVVWQLAKRRAGTAHTQTRGEVSRTGSKFGRQKGGGARHGSRRANIFVGGATTFGPRTRSFAFSLPKKVRQAALKSAFATKAQEGNLVILDEAKLAAPKTKDLASKLKGLNLEKATFVVDSSDENFELASRNLPHVRVVPTEGANVYDILHSDKLVMTKAAIAMIEARVGA